MLKTELKFGIVGGLAICVYKYIEFLPGLQTTRLDTGIYTGLLSFVIVIAIIVWGVKSKGNDEQDRRTFREAFLSGMIIAIVMTLIASPFMYIYGKYINPQQGDYMIHYILSNRAADALPVSPQELHNIYEYYSPSHRSIHTGEDIMLAGFFVSLFSAGMFKSVHHEDLDLVKKRVVPSALRRLFLMSMLLAMVPILVYISWVLKYENISTQLFDFLIEPISDGILQAGTAVLSLTALVINIIIYNRISHYSHHRKIWNILMIVVCGTLFFISLWPVL